ncbi:MAG: hypothetical protein E6H71_10060 [Betaproteobacteria bacterium]|nr:MAG: hypothetical protein E6H71_10060 [Betaproteobacteria bacterium]
MEHAIPDAHHCHGGEQPRRIGRKRRGQRCANQQRHAGQQDRTSAGAVDDKTGGKLRDAARDVKHPDERSEQRERGIEIGAQQREERRQRKLEEMRQTMSDADEHDDACVATERAGSGIQND